MKADFLKILDEEYPTFDPSQVVKNKDAKPIHEDPKDNPILESKEAKTKGQPK